LEALFFPELQTARLRVRWGTCTADYGAGTARCQMGDTKGTLAIDSY